jgi:hypothetical protein
VRAIGRGVATTIWELTSIPSAWRTGEFIGELINTKPTLETEKKNQATAAAIQQQIIQRSQQIMGGLEAEKNRVLALVNQANAAFSELEKAMNQAIDHENKARELLKPLKPNGGATEASQNPSERAKSLKQKIQDQINKIKQESQGISPLTAQIKDAANQVCSLVDLIEKERDPKSREDLLNAAKQHAATAQNANTQVQKIGNTVKASLEGAKTANEELKQIIEMLEKASKAQDTLKEAVDKIKGEANQAETASQTAQTQALDLVKYAEQARTAADGFSRRVNAMIDVGALNVGQLMIMKATVEKALITMRDDLASHHSEEAKTSAKNAADSATQAEKLLTDAKSTATGTESVTPADDLVGDVATEALQTAFDINEAEGEAKRAQRCIDKVLKPGVADKTTLSGHVIDKKTGQPISGASVSASGSISDNTTTNAAGDYSFANLELNTAVQLTASAEGYKSYFKSIRILDDDPYVGFALEAREAGSDKGATLAGIVVAKDTGKPIANASIQVDGKSVAVSPGGTFGADGLSLNSLVTVTAMAEGYLGMSRPVKIVTAETPVTIALAPEIKSIELSWSPSDPGPGKGVTVTATIVPRRAGVAIRVTVVGTDKYRSSPTLLTDANGSVSLFVPGAKKGVIDTITAEVVGTSFRKEDRYVF